MIPFSNSSSIMDIKNGLPKYGIIDFQRSHSYGIEVLSCPSSVFNSLASSKVPLEGVASLADLSHILTLVNQSVIYAERKTTMKQMKWRGNSFYVPVGNADKREGDLVFASDSAGAVMVFFTALWQFFGDGRGSSHRLYGNGNFDKVVPTSPRNIGEGDPFSLKIVQFNHSGQGWNKDFGEQEIADYGKGLGPRKTDLSVAALFCILSGVKVAGVHAGNWKRDESNIDSVTVSINWDDSYTGVITDISADKEGAVHYWGVSGWQPAGQ